MTRIGTSIRPHIILELPKHNTRTYLTATTLVWEQSLNDRQSQAMQAVYVEWLYLFIAMWILGSEPKT